MGVWSHQLINHHQIMYFLLLLLGLATSSPVPQHLRVQAREGQTLAQSRQDFQDIDVPAGEAVHIFYRYGFFSLSVRVVPRDDHGSWIIREPTTKIFTEQSLRQVKQVSSNKFDSQFQIFFCDDLSELMKHYFHDFSAEGVRDPHRLYTGSWRTPTIVKLEKPRLEVKTEGSPVL